MLKERIRWDEVRQRLNLMKLASKLGVGLACERMGKHRSFYYYWRKRYLKKGWRGLKNESCHPKRMPRLTEEKKVRAVVRWRKKTNYGKERLHDLLKERGVILPVSTIGKILDRAGLLCKRRVFKTQKKHLRCYNLIYPGQRVQMDLKFVPSEKCPFGKRFYQYTVTDECTRMRYLAWHDSIWTQNVVQTLKEASEYFAFKLDTVQTDNGIEFTFDYTAQLTAKLREAKEHPLDAYCRKKQMRHQLIPPGQKELNGKVERSHRTDEEEFYRNLGRVKSLEELREKGKKWMEFYNFKRRHSGINKKTPGEFAKERLKLYPHRIAA